MDLHYNYDITRSRFGRQPLFCETRVELCDTVPPDKQLQRDFMLRNPVHRDVQYTMPLSIATTNTPCAEYTSTGIDHAEGGWPRDINTHDPEALQRYRRRVEKEDGYIHSVMTLTPTMERYIYQNNAIEMYQTYYSELPKLPKLEHCDCRTVNIYRDDPKNGSGRPITSISWQPDGGRRFAVTYVEVDFDRNTRAAVDAFIWDVEHPKKVEETLYPPSPLIDLQWCARDTNLLIGGLMNGQVCSWDRRAARKPAVLCPSHVAHRDLARSVLFINTKSGTEFFSGGADGALKWWDLRNMNEPTEELFLEIVKSANETPTLTSSNGVSSPEYQATIPTRFMVGTENGLVMIGNRKGKNPSDKLPGNYLVQLGPVYKVKRNPSFLKNFLTVGDWRARIWSEEIRESCIMWTPNQRHKITDGAWSPTRVSLILLTQDNGVVALWDLLRRQHEPVLTIPVCDKPLLRVSVHDEGKLFACGGGNGNIYLQELTGHLTCSDRHDKALLAQVFERKTKTQRILETRLRELRLKQRQEGEECSPSATSAVSDVALGDRDLLEAAADYMATLRKEQQSF